MSDNSVVYSSLDSCLILAKCSGVSIYVDTMLMWLAYMLHREELCREEEEFCEEDELLEGDFSEEEEEPLEDPDHQAHEMGQIIVRVRRRRNSLRCMPKQTGPKKDYISQLPTEILEKIFTHLDGKQLANCRVVCSRWCDVITQSDFLWHGVCKREMGIVALKAKENSSPNLFWYYIYRNLKLWPRIDKYKTQFNLFFMIPGNTSDVNTGDLNQGILVTNGTNCTKLLDVKRNSYKLIIINGTQICERILSKNNVTVLQLRENKTDNSCIYVQRTVQAADMSEEAVFKDIKLFIVKEDTLFYCTSKNAVYMVNLHANVMKETLCLESTFVIKELLVKCPRQRCPMNQCIIKVFTECGYVVTYLDSKVIESQFLHSWSWGYLQNKYSVLDEQNFISYLNKMMRLNVPTKHCIHYGFPLISIAILYNNMVIFATKGNKILMFDISKIHMEINESSFTVLGSIRKTETIEKICISETSVGPAIMIATKSRIYLCKIRFFPEDKDTSSPFDDEHMYARLTCLRDRLELKSKAARQANTRKRKLEP